MQSATFDLNAAAQTSDIPKDSKAGMTFKTMAVKKDDTLPYWDLNNNYLERSGGGSLTEGQYYTHAYVLNHSRPHVAPQAAAYLGLNEDPRIRHGFLRIVETVEPPAFKTNPAVF